MLARRDQSESQVAIIAAIVGMLPNETLNSAPSFLATLFRLSFNLRILRCARCSLSSEDWQSLIPPVDPRHLHQCTMGYRWHIHRNNVLVIIRLHLLSGLKPYVFIYAACLINERNCSGSIKPYVRLETFHRFSTD